jgi:hypothetical protein
MLISVLTCKTHLNNGYKEKGMHLLIYAVLSTLFVLDLTFHNQ